MLKLLRDYGKLINNIPFNKLIMGIERGNRYVVNDKEKEEGEDRAIAINVERDQGI